MNRPTNLHRHSKKIVHAGRPLEEASKAMILVHGRGATPHSILELEDHLKLDDFALLAPTATANTWYPFSFMAAKEQNEPGLSTALGVLKQMIDDILAAGIKKENIYFLGFSQGACLTSEFVARNADTYGGVFVYSGGVIGDNIEKDLYKGDFGGTPILLGCSDVDAHVPLHRVQESTKIFREMGAKVVERIYPNAPHTIFPDEIDITNKILEGTYEFN